MRKIVKRSSVVHVVSKVGKESRKISKRQVLQGCEPGVGSHSNHITNHNDSDSAAHLSHISLLLCHVPPAFVDAPNVLEPKGLFAAGLAPKPVLLVEPKAPVPGVYQTLVRYELGNVTYLHCYHHQNHRHQSPNSDCCYSSSCRK